MITITNKKKKRPGMGKAKGNGFESTIAKKLSTALFPLQFMRTPGSGARVGGKNFQSFGKILGEDALNLFSADVVPVNEKDVNLKFLYSIECKFYKTPDSFNQLVAGTANIFSWVQEAINDAQKTNKLPMLIFKWNNTPIYVAIPHPLESENIKCNLVISNKNIEIGIFLFDELITQKEFWYTERC